MSLREHRRDEYELERIEDELDRRPCALCEHMIGLRGSVTRAGFIYHDECADSICHLCGQYIHGDEEVADPSGPSFGFKDMGERAHLECCREAANESRSIRRSDEDDFKRASGRGGE